MTLGLFVPSLMLVLGLFEAMFFLHLRNNGRMREGVANLLIITALTVPLVLYALLNFLVPEIGTMVLF